MNRRRPADRGYAAIEFLSMLPIVLVAIGLGIEVLTSFLTVERVENAARTGARVASMSNPAAGREAAREAMPSWVNERSIEVGMAGQGTVDCTIRAKVPLLWKGIPFDVTVVRRVQMPVG